MPISNQVDENYLKSKALDAAEELKKTATEAELKSLQTSGTYLPKDTNEYQKSKIDEAINDNKDLKDEINKKFDDKTYTQWPHSLGAAGGQEPGQNKTGFLSPYSIKPIKGEQYTGDPIQKFSEDYVYKDWKGQILQDEPGYPKNILSTDTKFKSSNKLPKTNDELMKEPHSMRDVPLIFNDTRTDFFKFGLQSIDNLTPIENPINGNSTLRKDQFKGTPWEQNEPIYYGFDIIIDSLSSPLLNGSVIDFINNYSSINEISSKRQVYEEFKNQFIKFFRTNASVKIDQSQLFMTYTSPNFATMETQTGLKNQQRGKAYLGHYIKKINGLDLLIEKNKGQAYYWAPKYKEDMIEITISEDVSMSLSTLAHLYKLLYWSKPSGKHLIPENLLRFNCQIIVSEVRNLQRVRKNIESGNFEVLKDNLSRWLYNLRECQFYFDKMPVPNEIDMGSDPKEFEGQTISFDFKFSSVKLERFVPDGKGWGKYVGYNGGSIWKIGNKGSRASRNTGASSESSNPAFFENGIEQPYIDGVDKPYVIAVYGDQTKEAISTAVNSLDVFKKTSQKNSDNSLQQKFDASVIKNNINNKTKNNLISFLSGGKLKSISDLKSQAIGGLKNSLLSKLSKGGGSSPSTPFFSGLSGLSTAVSALGNVVSMANNKLSIYDNILNKTPGPYEKGNAASGAKIDIFSLPSSNFVSNKLNEDAKIGKWNFAGQQMNSYMGSGYLASGYNMNLNLTYPNPPVPFRAFPNNFANADAQSNIVYIPKAGSTGGPVINGVAPPNGYYKPIPHNFNKNRGPEPVGIEYVYSQVSAFAGGSLSDLIFTNPGTNQASSSQ